MEGEDRGHRKGRNLLAVGDGRRLVEALLCSTRLTVSI